MNNTWIMSYISNECATYVVFDPQMSIIHFIRTNFISPLHVYTFDNSVIYMAILSPILNTFETWSFYLKLKFSETEFWTSVPYKEIFKAKETVFAQSRKFRSLIHVKLIYWNCNAVSYHNIQTHVYILVCVLIYIPNYSDTV